MEVLVGIGGTLGAVGRFYLGKIIASYNKKNYPYPTFLINLLGCIALGKFTYMHSINNMSDSLFMILGVGFCGAFTTFSTFGYETLSLLIDKRYKIAISYVLLSVLLGIIGVFIGMNL